MCEHILSQQCRPGEDAEGMSLSHAFSAGTLLADLPLISHEIMLTGLGLPAASPSYRVWIIRYSC